MEYITLNPEYILKQDNGYVLIMTKDPLRTLEPVIESVLHPIHAKILSFFTGTLPRTEAINAASRALKLEPEIISELINKLTNNTNSVVAKYDEKSLLVFPVRTLLPSEEPLSRETYDFNILAYKKFNLKKTRHFTPSRITFMVTTKCHTNCIYCYADRRKNIIHLPFEKVKNMVLEAKKLNVVSFDVIGGEFFLYEHWKELLAVLYQNSYNPYISTKIPISEEDVIYLKSVGVKDIQISLDTLLPDHLTAILKVNSSYAKRIKQTLFLLDKYGIKIQLHTILTRINNSLKDIESIYDFIRDLPSVASWKVDFAASTLYRDESEYSKIKIERENLAKINTFFKDLKEKNMPFSIISGDLDVEANPNPNELSIEEKNKFYTNRRSVFCSGNFSSVFILPDGKVTICEELYWNPKFIIGDLSLNSLEEIWNSPKAKELYFLSIDKISHKTPCRKCAIFNECRHELGGVCWREVIKIHGEENWDFPDPKCPKSEKTEKDIYI